MKSNTLASQGDASQPPYSVSDTLYLWYLGRPARPDLIGSLQYLPTLRGVSLRYSANWLRSGFALSEDLPLIDMEHLPREKDCAAGAVDDARPDRWGERVIRLIERPSRLSVLEMLFFAGAHRFGALGVSTSETEYLPARHDVLPDLGEVNAIHALVRKVLAGDHPGELQRRLIAPGTSLGGVRPKALIQIDGAQWIVKFAEADRPNEPLVEYAAMTLAAKTGISVAQTRAIKLARGHAVAIKRFDRLRGMRKHGLSANTALKAAGLEPGYPALAQLLRRRGETRDGLNRRQMRELFRRLVFNILIDNTDDHEKNHVLLLNDAHNYLLSPAFDVLPTGNALGYQSMQVGEHGAQSTIDNALSACQAYWLKPGEALAEARGVARGVEQWRAHFKKQGVNAKDIEALAAQIDGPALLPQRRALLK
jgi:serine/threonine-protein kinase HipA